MVVKSRLRKPHRPLCLCCAETGALPFSLRRATGDVDHTWDGADDDDGDDESISTRARVLPPHAPGVERDAFAFDPAARAPCTDNAINSVEPSRPSAAAEAAAAAAGERTAASIRQRLSQQQAVCVAIAAGAATAAGVLYVLRQRRM